MRSIIELESIISELTSVNGQLEKEKDRLFLLLGFVAGAIFFVVIYYKGF